MKKTPLSKSIGKTILVTLPFLFSTTKQLSAQIVPNKGDSTKALQDTIPKVRDTILQLHDSTLQVFAQSDTLKPTIYKMNYWGAGLFSVAATVANLIAIPTIIHNKKELTPQELQAANSHIFNSLDKWALELDPSKRESYYQASDFVLPGIVAVSGATFLLNKTMKKDWLKLLMMYYEMHAITFAIYDFSFFGPAFQNKLRPIVYYPYFSVDERKGGNQRNSMYSGHTASAVASTFFAVKVYCDYHPGIGGKKYLLYGLASVPPLVEGYLRVKALAHFPSDVMIGFVIGAVCGVVVPEAHRIKIPGVQLNTYFNGQSGGARLCWKWK